MLAMEERIRITFDVPERVRRALNICAARMDKSVGEVIELWAAEMAASDLELADQSISEGKDGPKPRKGRKPKPPE